MNLLTLIFSLGSSNLLLGPLELTFPSTIGPNTTETNHLQIFVSTAFAEIGSDTEDFISREGPQNIVFHTAALEKDVLH